MGTLTGLDPIAEEAARWLLELEDARPQTLHDFAAWLERSPVTSKSFCWPARCGRSLPTSTPHGARISSDSSRKQRAL